MQQAALHRVAADTIAVFNPFLSNPSGSVFKTTPGSEQPAGPKDPPDLLAPPCPRDPHLKVDPVELVEACPCAAAGQTLEELALRWQHERAGRQGIGTFS